MRPFFATRQKQGDFAQNSSGDLSLILLLSISSTSASLTYPLSQSLPLFSPSLAPSTGQYFVLQPHPPPFAMLKPDTTLFPFCSFITQQPPTPSCPNTLHTHSLLSAYFSAHLACPMRASDQNGRGGIASGAKPTILGHRYTNLAMRSAARSAARWLESG